MALSCPLARSDCGRRATSRSATAARTLSPCLLDDVPDPLSGRLAHRLLIERGVDETVLPPEQLRVRERMFLARNFASAWLTAALIQFGMLVVPAEGRHEGVILAIAGAGVGASIVHFVLYERIPLGAYQGSLVVGWAAAGFDVWAAGEQAIVSVLFFAWIAVYAAAIFGLRALVRQLPIATVALTVALAENEASPDPWFAPFAIATIATMCVLVYVGNVRTQRLFIALVKEREARERTVRHRQLVAELGTAALAAESLDVLREVSLARLADEGYSCTIGPRDAPPAAGLQRFEIPGTEASESAPGRGTTFRAHLPVHVPAPVALAS